jgi:hypothetical protein
MTGTAASGNPEIKGRRGMGDSWAMSDMHAEIQPKSDKVEGLARGLEKPARGFTRDLPKRGTGRITNDHPALGGGR